MSDDRPTLDEHIEACLANGGLHMPGQRCIGTFEDGTPAYVSWPACGAEKPFMFGSGDQVTCEACLGMVN